MISNKKKFGSKFKTVYHWKLVLETYKSSKKSIFEKSMAYSKSYRTRSS